jgi:hypothetical protein
MYSRGSRPFMDGVFFGFGATGDVPGRIWNGYFGLRALRVYSSPGLQAGRYDGQRM